MCFGTMMWNEYANLYSFQIPLIYLVHCVNETIHTVFYAMKLRIKKTFMNANILMFSDVWDSFATIGQFKFEYTAYINNSVNRNYEI